VNHVNGLKTIIEGLRIICEVGENEPISRREFRDIILLLVHESCDSNRITQAIEELDQDMNANTPSS
jgi:hypothetical protein